jgi:molecular chaperone DnaK (HSP70)
MNELIVGIDLGTTNSEIAALVDGQVRVLGPADARMLPSCVGFTTSGELLVGEPARNQQRLYPERTVRSIKRQMGSGETVAIAGRDFSPQEISALILRELVAWAERSLGQRPQKAVITVPAYFSDAQRNATREAGALAGLEVIRILNEPTAASLAYGYGEGTRQTTLVYDLGGGTFDVSIVVTEGDVTEVLASHGNNRLGGDDFDDLLVDYLASVFQDRHGLDPRGQTAARARLWWAAEEAKKTLSVEPYARIREEALTVADGTPLHLDLEISREEYEAMIRPLVDSTLESVSKALQDARLSPRDVDGILLVGGSTRTPLVSMLLRERTGLDPRQDVHPDLCVALGAGVLASRLAGNAVDRVLVDVSPYSFGISYLGERGGALYPHCYRPIIQRNTPLPLTRTERYVTSYPYQTIVDVQVHQGEDADALKNVLVGDFRVEGLTPTEEANEVLCRMRLDLDGILEVTAVEKRSGKSTQITIANALRARSADEIAAGQQRIRELYESRLPGGEGEWERPADDEWDVEEEEGAAVVANGTAVRASAAAREASGGGAPRGASAGADDLKVRDLLERSRQRLEQMHADDREEAIELHERIAAAIEAHDRDALREASRALGELLFFVEGKAG